MRSQRNHIDAVANHLNREFVLKDEMLYRGVRVLLRKLDNDEEALENVIREFVQIHKG